MVQSVRGVRQVFGEIVLVNGYGGFTVDLANKVAVAVIDDARFSQRLPAMPHAGGKRGLASDDKAGEGIREVLFLVEYAAGVNGTCHEKGAPKPFLKPADSQSVVQRDRIAKNKGTVTFAGFCL